MLVDYGSGSESGSEDEKPIVTPKLLQYPRYRPQWSTLRLSPVFLLRKQAQTAQMLVLLPLYRFLNLVDVMVQ
jgi:hypothetical protein